MVRPDTRRAKTVKKVGTEIQPSIQGGAKLHMDTLMMNGMISTDQGKLDKVMRGDRDYANQMDPNDDNKEINSSFSCSSSQDEEEKSPDAK